MERHRIAAVILAAGTSNRLGRKAKQLLPLGERRILQHVIDLTIQQEFDQILVVIGYQAKRVQKMISLQGARQANWLVNDQYRDGQSKSFLMALAHINPMIQSVMFFLGDQPFIKHQTIEQIKASGLKRQLKEEKPFVVRPSYNGKVGHPIYWGNHHCIDFESVTGDEGGRSLFKFIKVEQIEVEDFGVGFDIDTPKDYQEALAHLERVQ
ncbi:nucleotidyltransferase family protein [Halalkalibacter krulwichiae]|uniref:Nicotine blue oxidoreductase n=1 Tax=Halalkalibacter krulwichiae TaxID=199441 RepID=A0A1X9M666_9BACI|nr:nucleotidyltransferase family protein [Halalkalibacter krulwichiae]ARK28936.1 Nicotine blue oxidoreductase [Halalkalibacter krulwichiae]